VCGHQRGDEGEQGVSGSVVAERCVVKSTVFTLTAQVHLCLHHNRSAPQTAQGKLIDQTNPQKVKVTQLFQFDGAIRPILPNSICQGEH